MPSWKEVYGEYLTGVDMAGKAVVATVKSSEKKLVGEDNKIVLAFHELEKSLPLNVTNCKVMEEIAGTDDFTKWIGAEVEIFGTKTDFGRKTVDAVRIRKPIKQA